MTTQVARPDEPTRYCEWFVLNGELATSCGIKKQYDYEDEEHSDCPRCKGAIIYGEWDDEDGDFDWDA